MNVRKIGNLTEVGQSQCFASHKCQVLAVEFYIKANKCARHSLTLWEMDTKFSVKKLWLYRGRHAIFSFPWMANEISNHIEPQLLTLTLIFLGLTFVWTQVTWDGLWGLLGKDSLLLFLKGTSTIFYTLTSVYRSWEYCCICKKGSTKPFVAPNCLQWCLTVAQLHCE